MLVEMESARVRATIWMSSRVVSPCVREYKLAIRLFVHGLDMEAPELLHRGHAFEEARVVLERVEERGEIVGVGLQVGRSEQSQEYHDRV